MQTPSVKKIDSFWYRNDHAIRWVAFIVLLADGIRQIVIS